MGLTYLLPEISLQNFMLKYLWAAKIILFLSLNHNIIKVSDTLKMTGKLLFYVLSQA